MVTDERLGAEDLRTRLSDVLNRVEYRRESILITKRGKVVARIVPVDDVVLADEPMPLEPT